ncbi:MAG: pyridoxamine 5'-phosphate oxidase family protein [Pseudomonadota bacterium]
MNLVEIEADAWAALERATTDPKSAFRYLNLCSVDHLGAPQARMVVLRSASPSDRSLEFHTDTRSSKWQEFSLNPNATVLGYCPDTRTQLRFKGRVRLFGAETEQAEKAWNTLAPWTRTTYQGGPPGDDLALQNADGSKGADPNDSSTGKDCFGVIIFDVTVLDWFQLHRQNNKRAEFDYKDDRGHPSMRWLNP